MAEAAATLSLSEQYLLKEKEEKPVVDEKPVEVQGESVPAPAVSEESHSESTVGIAETVMDKAVETAEAVAEKAVEITEAVTDGITEGTPVATEEPTETAPAAAETSSEDAPPASEETTEQPTEENSGTEEVAEAPEIKLETAPADFRFPTTNQTRHCFTRYIEYHRCVAAKGDDAQDCQKFAKYYRSLCPSEWVDRWNEQRENGTFPGPL